jgi:hypothetical protein
MSQASGDRQRYLARLMRDALQRFEREDSLDRLVADLASLIDSAKDVASADWIDELRDHWWQLEVVHALSLDEDGRGLTEEEIEAVDNAITALVAMLEEY